MTDSENTGGATLDDGLKAAAETSALIESLIEERARGDAAEKLLEEARVAHQQELAGMAAALEESQAGFAAVIAGKAKVERKLARVEKGPAPKKARRIAREGGSSGAAQLDRAELAELMNCGAAFDVVFCEGGKETLAVRPIRVAGEAWVQASGAIVLREAVEIASDAPPGCEIAIDGLALFDSVGEQVAYRALPEPIRVSAGRTYRLERTVSF